MAGVTLDTLDSLVEATSKSQLSSPKSSQATPPLQSTSPGLCHASSATVPPGDPGAGFHSYQYRTLCPQADLQAAVKVTLPDTNVTLLLLITSYLSFSFSLSHPRAFAHAVLASACPSSVSNWPSASFSHSLVAGSLPRPLATPLAVHFLPASLLPDRVIMISVFIFFTNQLHLLHRKFCEDGTDVRSSPPWNWQGHAGESPGAGTFL